LSLSACCCKAFVFSSRPILLPSNNNDYNKRTVLFAAEEEKATTVYLTTEIDDEKVERLFAWISRCLFYNDPRYNNMFAAFAGIFGNLPADNPISKLAEDAYNEISSEEEICGGSFPMLERQENSLGAMGAGQWTGQWKTRPHALLQIQNFTCVDEWIQTLPRGCKRTLKKAMAQNITVTARPIPNDAPAPHSSLAHFRCVIEHEVRLLTEKKSRPDYFFDSLSEAISRYVQTTRMSGEIREYRNSETNKIIAFAHEVRKGKTIRGQWFYATDEASKSYVWFHSVFSLVQRAISNENIDVVDLGPSGTNSFSDLKERYGFLPVDDWPSVADYTGPFWSYESNSEEIDGLIM